MRQLSVAARLCGVEVHGRLLASAQAGQAFPLNKVLPDCVHIYFLNGIAARELPWMQAAAWEKRPGHTLEGLPLLQQRPC